MRRAPRCDDCGTAPASMSLTGVGTFCDRCGDHHVAGLTGFAVLPDPPAPLTITGPDGRRHRLVFRLRRGLTGICVELNETSVRGGEAADDEGYQFSILGPHNGPVEELIARVVAIARREIATPYLEPAKHRDGWTVGDGDVVAGRFTFNPHGGPYHVVVDGRALSWEQLGEAMEPYEGWRFRLVIEDPGEDVRPDADVVPLPTKCDEADPGC